jgi:hypothetical protein
MEQSLFEREVKLENGNMIKIKDILDEEKDIYIQEDGVVIMRHVGIAKLKTAVGANWDFEPTVIETPTSTNDFGYVFSCKVVFPDKSESVHIGEASNINTKQGTISRSYKATMALKRGRDRAFLRSEYMGLDDIYSESEIEKSEKKINKKPETPSHLQKYEIHLSKDDPKYPNLPVFCVWETFKDKEYLEILAMDELALTKKTPNWIAKGMLVQIEKSLQTAI